MRDVTRMESADSGFQPRHPGSRFQALSNWEKLPRLGSRPVCAHSEGSPQRHRTRLMWREKSREETRCGLSKRRRRPVTGVERGREECAGAEGKMDGKGLIIFNFSAKSPLIPSLALFLPLPHLNVAKFWK